MPGAARRADLVPRHEQARPRAGSSTATPGRSSRWRRNRALVVDVGRRGRGRRRRHRRVAPVPRPQVERQGLGPVEREPGPLRPLDHVGDVVPPGEPGRSRKPVGDEEGGGDAERLQDRQRGVEVVAVAVVERDQGRRLGDREARSASVDQLVERSSRKRSRRARPARRTPRAWPRRRARNRAAPTGRRSGGRSAPAGRAAARRARGAAQAGSRSWRARNSRLLGTHDDRRLMAGPPDRNDATRPARHPGPVATIVADPPACHQTGDARGGFRGNPLNPPFARGDRRPFMARGRSCGLTPPEASEPTAVPPCRRRSRSAVPPCKGGIQGGSRGHAAGPVATRPFLPPSRGQGRKAGPPESGQSS